MTSQIDFYILDEPNLNASVHFITRLIDKAYRQGNSLKIIGDTNLLSTIDQALWQQFDFIPHQFNKKTASIIIRKLFDKEPVILLNLNPDSIQTQNNWQRIIHIIPNNEQQKLAAREAYRYYQQSKSNIKTHKIKASSNEQQISTG